MTAQRAAQHDSTARGSENSRRASAICILSPEFRCFNNVIQNQFRRTAPKHLRGRGDIRFYPEQTGRHDGVRRVHDMFRMRTARSEKHKVLRSCTTCDGRVYGVKKCAAMQFRKHKQHTTQRF